jgi:hypothetical protein
MIGIKARGLRHAVKIAAGEPRQIIYFSEGNSYPKEGMLFEHGGEVYVLNNEVHNTRHANGRCVEELMSKYNLRHILCFDKSHLTRNEYLNYVKFFYILPKDFDKQYQEFILSNKKFFANLAEKIGQMSFNNAFSKHIYAISDGSKNFFQWAHNCKANNVSVVTIEQILRWNENYQQLAKNLKKGSITAYTKYNDLFALIDEQMVLRREKRVSNTINMFNTQQKKLLKELPFSDDIYNVMSRFNRLSDVKKNNFIRKMSTVDDASEIIHQMSFLADYHFKWNKNELLDYIKNNEMVSAEIIYDKDDILIVRVEDYDTIKRLAKNTSWCISKNKTYWNNYMSKSHIANGVRQYVLFDFSKKEDDERSIVGFTLHVKKGITASHDFVNTNILDKKFSMNAYLRKRFNTLVPNKSVNGGIHAILMEKGIDISSLLKTGKIPYLWNSDSFFKHLNACFDGDDSFYDILSANDGKIAVLVENENIHKFFGDRYVNNISPDIWGNEHILFLDFNESPDTPNKLLYGIIEYNEKTKEWYCNVIRNEQSDPMPITFDSLLDEYELPYDIICRADDKYSRIINAFASYDLNTVKKLIADKEIVKLLKDKTDSYTIYNSIFYTIETLVSDEYIKTIYENGLSLYDFLTNEQISCICDMLINKLTRVNILPENSDYEALLKRDGSIDNMRAEALAGCYILNMIIANEKNSETLNLIKNRVISNAKHTQNAFLKETAKEFMSEGMEPSLTSKGKRITINSF